MIEIKPKKNVTMLVGTRFPAKIDGVAPVGYKPDVKRTVPCAVNHHDTVVDVLKTLALPTDGSMLLLEPGTIEPFDLDDLPYSELKEGGKYEIVPNRPDQIGPFAVEADQMNANSFALSLLPPKAVPVVIPVAPEPSADYPKLLSDPSRQEFLDAKYSVFQKQGEYSRPDVSVDDLAEEQAARADGYTVEVPKPKS